jgi:hypothetical protein
VCSEFSENIILKKRKEEVREGCINCTRSCGGVGHLASMENMIKAYRTVILKREGHCPHGRPTHKRIIIKLILNKYGCYVRWKVLKCGAGEGWRRSVGPIM